MKVWIGHYDSNPKEWFVVWAHDGPEARYLADEIGPLDIETFRELVSSGFVNFHVEYNEDQPTFSPAKDKARRDQWLYLGNQSLNPNEYISASFSQKENNQKLNMKVWLGDSCPTKRRTAENALLFGQRTNKKPSTWLIKSSET